MSDLHRRLYKRFRKLMLATLRQLPRLRRFTRRFYYGRRQRQYERRWRGLMVEEQTVFFEAYLGSSYACSPKALYESMVADERFAGWRFIWSFKDEVIKRATELTHEGGPLCGAELVTRGSAAYFAACATARYWVLNSRMPEWVYPKPEQVFVQCWHGTPLKRLGHDILIETAAALNTSAELRWRYAIDAAKWTYLLSPSPVYSKRITSAFALDTLSTWPERPVIIEEGYPRNDALACAPAPCQPQPQPPDNPGDECERLKARLGLPPDRKVLLCAFTWRDSSYQASAGYTHAEENRLDLSAMRAAIGGEWVVLLRDHYLVGSRSDLAEQADFAFEASDVFDINELYLVSDALLTDYSSVLFDYANTLRPTIYFWPDFHHYATELRGFYQDPAELPGDACTTTTEVIAAMTTLDTWQERHGEQLLHFKETYCPLDDGQATHRVIKRIFGA
ncbi:MAG: CDP-glycerol glycerophosphotransferase family protein [Coriobacteriales bacterium]|jgi:CDP-glycerol glycerophosphotransferase|nr:CDP-glycerol glycerophosphotransferase family protein [Coriobacteriales bacterium]